MSTSDLPHLNALFNTLSACLLVIGHRFIRRGAVRAHKLSMISALAFSLLFLISYVVYHAFHGSRPFPGEGWIRPIYFGILLTHTFLAVVNVWLVVVTLARGLGGRFKLHRKIAKWTYPVWLYVSISGIVIYLLLYQIYGRS